MSKISKVNLIDIIIWCIAVGILLFFLLNSCTATYIKIKDSDNSHIKYNSVEEVDSIKYERDINLFNRTNKEKDTL
jgi:hypothetical protein